MTQSLSELQPPAVGASDSILETYYFDDAIVRKFLVAMFIWGAVAMLVGLYVALDMVYPRLNFGMPFLAFGRLRPLHTNAAIFAFAGNAMPPSCVMQFFRARCGVHRHLRTFIDALRFGFRSEIEFGGQLDKARGIGAYNISERRATDIAVHRRRPVELRVINRIEGLDTELEPF